MHETHLVFPQLEAVYRALAPVSEAMLRVVVGLWMVPHGLRMAFGFFPGTGIRQGNVRMLAADLDTWGYRPGWLWAPLIAATELVAGPLLALGLFTRAAAIIASGEMAIGYFLFHAPEGFYPYVNHGELAIMYCFVFLYLVFAGAGPWSLDALFWGKRANP
jgi:putative oxidoreductase